ncbi:MAG: hypothetical protein GWN30_08475, partial [Gammaproteobacteria bacterium]|nr:hypothetical protein [Gammaproteobacteria bacterium]
MEITSRKSLLMMGLLLVFAVLLGTTHPSLAADITVTTTSDLRDAGD